MRIDSSISSTGRVYVRTQWGEPGVDGLRALGATWDKGAKAWWLPKDKEAQVKALVAKSEMAAAQDKPAGGAAPAPQGQAPAEDPHEIRLAGKCLYKGRNYYARYFGPTKRGLSARLVSFDGRVDFWAPADDSGSHDGQGAVAVMVKAYQPRRIGFGPGAKVAYTTLGSIQDFVARKKAEEAGAAPAKAPAPAGSLAMRAHAGQGNWQGADLAAVDDGFAGGAATEETGRCELCGAWGTCGEPCPACTESEYVP